MDNAGTVCNAREKPNGSVTLLIRETKSRNGRRSIAGNEAKRCSSSSRDDGNAKDRIAMSHDWS